MFAVLFLLLIFINGYILKSIFLKQFSRLANISSSFIIGSLVSVSYIYLLTSYLFHNLSYSLIVYLISSLIVFIAQRKYLRGIQSIFCLSKFEICFIFLAFVFSWYLFGKTFSYDSIRSEFLISSNIYLDFGAHIPFIRSFSIGNNFPMEVPFFAGKNLIYHMMFDLYAGILEYLGLRIDIALNLISSLSFSFLLILIYELSNIIFLSKKIGIISIVLFLFPSDLSFINFLQRHDFNLSLMSAFWHNSFFLVDGPLGKNTVSVLWNLNTFFNQRHLIFGLSVAVLFIYILLDLIKNKQNWHTKTCLFLGTLLGLLPFWHTSIYIALNILLFGSFIFGFNTRKKLIIIIISSLVLAIPEVLIIKQSSMNEVFFNPGFLMNSRLTLQNISLFWIWNLGLSSTTLILGFILSNRFQKKLFVIFLFLFIVPNLFQFGKDIYDNHKFFNFWIIMVNAYSAYFLTKLFFKNTIFKILTIILIFFLTFSGLLNIMVTKNDVYTRITDYQSNSLLSWIVRNIPNDKIVLTNGEIYDPASLLGKRVFLTRVHYIYLYGGNPDSRARQLGVVFKGEEKNKIKEILRTANVSYLVIYKNRFAKNIREVNTDFIEKNFQNIYDDQYGSVYKI